MSEVFLCSEFNSTTFTKCCETAISDESCCPKCGKEIYPKGADTRWRSAYANFKKNKEMING